MTEASGASAAVAAAAPWSLLGLLLSPQRPFFHHIQGLLNQMDRTLRALAKFESSNPGLILGTQITPLGMDFFGP